MHKDEKHPRVKHWTTCPLCATITPLYLFVVDHISPVVPLHSTAKQMSLDEIVDAIWCEKSNLQAICKECHRVKTASERKKRDLFKKSS